MRRCVFLLTLTISCSVVGSCLDADSFTDLVGYTIVAASTVKGDFEGCDYDKLIGLDNGMIFECSEYNYSYAYRPTAIVFARTYSTDDFRKLGSKTIPSGPITLYKILVDDELYEVRRRR
jgi:hypothetical protein